MTVPHAQLAQTVNLLHLIKDPASLIVIQMNMITRDPVLYVQTTYQIVLSAAVVLFVQLAAVENSLRLEVHPVWIFMDVDPLIILMVVQTDVKLAHLLWTYVLPALLQLNVQLAVVPHSLQLIILLVDLLVHVGQEIMRRGMLAIPVARL